MASWCFSGCAYFWDDVTNRNFSLGEFIRSPNPFLVLRDSDDGNKRARAFRSLEEPKTHGGTDQDQDAVVKILTAAATTERQPLCRLAALEALGRFQDPRVVPALKEAYFNAGNFPKDKTASAATEGLMGGSAVSTPLVLQIKCQAIASLGHTGNPEAIGFLVDVLNNPPASKESAEGQRQQLMDERIAAARALGNFKDYKAIEALVGVLKSEKDVALLDRAHDSLEACTGQKLPPDMNDWGPVLNPENKPQLASEPAKHTDPAKHSLIGWFHSD
jgi:HEAT repeat protein